MMTIQTGYQVPDYSKGTSDSPVSPSGASDKKRPKKTVFPEFTLRGEAADALIDRLEAGSEFTATVRFNLSRTEKRSGSPREWESEEEANRSVAEVEVLEINLDEGTGSAENESDEEESAEDAVDKYRSAKSTPADEEED